MDRTELRALVQEKLGTRSRRLGLDGSALKDDFDLVRSGLLDSLGFVDLITDLEGAVGRQVELEKAFDRAGATTLGGVLDLFLNGR